MPQLARSSDFFKFQTIGARLACQLLTTGAAAALLAAEAVVGISWLSWRSS
jgi:hypothetical protein